MNQLPFITALCPTYRRPELLLNSIWMWEQQSYPAHLRQLIILDDGGTFQAQAGNAWKLITHHQRAPSLPQKYNMLAGYASPATHAFLVWEDDDYYLPDYVLRYAEAFQNEAQYVKPAFVMSDYPGFLIKERGDGRFHATLGFTRKLYLEIGGWPVTKQAQFDQILIQRLQSRAAQIDPWGDGPPQYIYGWHTGQAHGQSTMQGGEDEVWYDKAKDLFAASFLPGQIFPQPSPRTRSYFRELGALPVGAV